MGIMLADPLIFHGNPLNTMASILQDLYSNDVYAAIIFRRNLNDS